MKKTDIKDFTNKYNGTIYFDNEEKYFNNKCLEKHKDMEHSDFAYIDKKNICHLIYPMGESVSGRI